jgi:ankyrin repeat protein
MLAAENGHAATVTLLLDKGADLNVQDKTGKTALMSAAAKGDAATVALLLDKRADLNLKDKTGKTALMWATQNGHTAIVETLVAHGIVASLTTSTSTVLFSRMSGEDDAKGNPDKSNKKP